MGEAEVPGAGEFEARGDDGCVEVDDGAELNLNAELHGGGRECFAVEDPASAVCKSRGERGQDTLALFVAEALNIKRLHGMFEPLPIEVCLPIACSSERERVSVSLGRGTVVM